MSMPSVNADAPPSVTVRAARSLIWVERGLLALVLALALFLRLGALDAFMTIDEPMWEYRSHQFSEALQRGDLASTYQSEHPGVLTMWLGALGERVAERLSPGQVAEPGTAGRASGIPPITLWGRRFIAVVTWIGLLALYPLLRRIMGHRPALLATSLVSLDPFYLAYSRFHHLDGLLTTFVLLSVLALAAYVYGGRRLGLLILAAITGGLAMANKSPGVLLAPWAALVLALAAWAGGREGRRKRLLGALRDLTLWGLVALGVLVLVWPALWVNPFGALGQVIAGALRQGGNPHEHSNYFWFAIRPDPGPAFYRFAWAFRTTPLVVLGLIGLIFWARRRPGAGLFLPLGLFILLYGSFLTVSEKKFDRYLLPVFPLLDILATLGYVALYRWVAPRLAGRRQRFAPEVGLAAVICGQMILLWPSRPYYLSYYDPLVGGSRTAPQIMLLGWGEGMDRAAAYLNAKPNAADLHVASQRLNELKPFFVGHTTLLGDVPAVEPDYFVLYAAHVQRQLLPDLSLPLWTHETPEQIIRVNGMDYAWIYRNPFYRAETEEILQAIEERSKIGEDVVVLNVPAAFRRSYAGPLPLAVVAGPARVDFALTGLERARGGYRRMWFLGFPATYNDSRNLLRELLDDQGERVEDIRVGDLRATCYELKDGASFVPPLPSAQPYTLGEEITLLGYSLDTTQVTPGQPLALRLFWRMDRQSGASYKVFTHLLGPDGKVYGQMDSVPQGGARATTDWRVGETIVDDYVLDVAEDAPIGEYTIEVGLYGAENGVRLPIHEGNGQRLADDRLLLRGLRRAAP